jgi:protocatechuate 3,4-dioxygenase beta subunit
MNARHALVHWIVAALVGLVVGVFAAPLLDAPEPVVARGPRGGEQAANDQKTAPRTAALDAAADVASSRAPSTVESGDVVISEAALARAVADVARPTVAAVEGTGVIKGSVMDRRGAPLAGVAIRATRGDDSWYVEDPAQRGLADFTDEPLEVALDRSAKAWAESRTERRNTRTDSAGRFTLDGLDPDAQYHVVARMAGYEVERAGGDGGYVAPGAEVSFVARVLGLVDVAIVDAAGAALEEGVVTVFRGDQPQHYTWKASAPQLKLEPGGFELRAFADVKNVAWSNDGALDAALASERTHVRIEAGANPPLTLVVAPRNGVRGEIVAPTGVATNQFYMRLAPVPDGADDLDEVLKEAGKRQQWYSNTRYWMDLAPGRYVVGALDSTGEVLGRETVDVADTIVDVAVVCSEPSADAALRVRALDPTGQPIGGFELRYTLRTGSSSSSSNMSALRWDGVTGIFRLPKNAGEKEDESGEYTLELRADDPAYGRATVELERGVRDAVLQFQETGILEVVVAGMATSGLAGRLSIVVSPVEDEDTRKRNMYYYGGFGGGNRRQLNLDGRATFDALTPGRYTVQLHVVRNDWDTQSAASQEIDVTVGRTSVTFDAPVLHRVVVLAPGLPEKTQISLSRKQEGSEQMRYWGGGNSQQTDANGRVVFEDIAAGTYVVGANGAASTLEITVPCADVLFEARVPDALRVSISDIEGLMHAAGLRSGDLLIAVDGNDPKSAAELQQLFWGASDDRELRVTVLRDGSALEFTIGVPDSGPRRAKIGGGFRQVLRDA